MKVRHGGTVLDCTVLVAASVRAEADRLLAITIESCRQTALGLADWMDVNTPQGLAPSGLAEGLRRPLEDIQPAGARCQRNPATHPRGPPFPNEASALRLVSAILADTSDDWKTGRIHIAMDQIRAFHGNME